MKIGPNMRRLLSEVGATVMMERVKSKDVGGIAERLLDRSFLGDMGEAAKRCNAYVAAMRAACEPNPFKNATDEEIAGEIVRRLVEKRNAANPVR